ncbi:cell wall hydrolase [Sphingomonas sp. GCM10030256]|uniref:cell wall hydrolase n=1 Tax=Sphingomonas sp. GCM10030256 TaxID=3273427 RepID=UPI00361697C8
MTAVQLARRRLAIRFGGLRLETLAFVLVAVPALLAAALSYAATLSSDALAPRGQSAAAQAIAPVQAAALIEATAGSAATAVQATGDDALKINAALPFSAAPLKAARPFETPTGGTSYDRALTCLTQAVYYEAGFEPLPGRRAVAQVILNRMRHPAFPKSVCGVVYQRNSTPVCQFSFVCDGSLNRAPAAAAWRSARDIAAAALAGHVEGSVGQATHYHANYVAPRWAPLLAKISQIGAHIFYRWPGAWGQPSAFTGRYAGEPADPSVLRPQGRVLAAAEVRSAGGDVTPTPLTQGPAIARAPNDVGGLLDTSKGWTLSIPVPAEIDRARTQVAEQQARPLAGTVVISATGGSVVAAVN